MAFFAFVTDCAYLVTERPFYLEVTRLALLVALIAGALAAVLDAVEFIPIPRANARNRLGSRHLQCAGAAVDGGEFPGPPPGRTGAGGAYGVILSTVTIVLILAGGWFGGEMAYRHGVGVSRSVGATGGTTVTGTRDDTGQG